MFRLGISLGVRLDCRPERDGALKRQKRDTEPLLPSAELAISLKQNGGGLS